MKNQLKVGQQFEVVEVLMNGGYHVKPFKLCGWTIAHNTNYADILEVLPNKYELITCQGMLTMIIGTEVKPVGRLTVTKIK